MRLAPSLTRKPHKDQCTQTIVVVGIDGSAVQAALWAVDEAVSRGIRRLLYASNPTSRARRTRRGSSEARRRRTRCATRSGGRGGNQVEVESPRGRPVLVDRARRLLAGALALSACTTSDQAGGIYRSGPGVIGAVPSGDHPPGLSDATPHGSSEADRSLISVCLGAVVLAAAARLAGSGGHCRQSGGGAIPGRRPCQPGPLKTRTPSPMCEVQSAAVHGELLDYLAGLGRRYTWWCSARATRSMGNFVGAPGNGAEAGCTCWSSVSSICDCAAG